MSDKQPIDEFVRFRVRDIQLGHPGLDVTLAVVSEDKGVPRCVGTAFLIGPGLGVTAAHVVQDWMQYQERSDGFVRADAQPLASAFQIYDGKMYRWVVKGAYSFVRTDIAFLRFFRPTWWGYGPGQVDPPWARLNLNPPELGDEVRVLGFPKSSIRDGNVLRVSPTESLGRITEVTHNTDNRGRPLSHAHLEGEIAPGMSGGPCFDKHGTVIGVNSKGWDFEQGPPLSYVALWWPTMDTPIDFFDTGHIPILNLLDQLQPAPVGRGRIFVTSKGEVRLGNVDPATLTALPMPTADAVLDGWLGKADKDMQEAISQIQKWISATPNDPGYLDSKVIYGSLQQFFWSLESAALIAMRLAAVRIGLHAGIHSADWDTFVAELSSRGNAEINDELAELGFAWYGVDLFEVREYANQARNAGLFIEADHSLEGINTAMLLPCRASGQDVVLPTGLARHAAATINFGRQLLRLAAKSAEPGELLGGSRSDAFA